MKNISPFQLAVIGFCLLFIIAGVIAFALLGGGLRGAQGGTVAVWGTLDDKAMQAVLGNLRIADKSLGSVTYVRKETSTYESELINAIAAGTGPDLFLLPQNDIAQFADKVQLIPYKSVSQSEFKESFVDEGALFLLPQGIIALPITVDPLVMYWNRDFYASGNLSNPPKYWSEFLQAAPALTQVDSSGGLKRSAVSLGLWDNVGHAKELFTTLAMQAGDPIVSQNAGTPKSVFGANVTSMTENPAEAAVRFYTDFADPGKSVYSWNRSLPRSVDAFTAGQLATYFGFVSEYETLLARNPNLHIGVALLPQAKGGSYQLTYGNVTGLAIARGAKNPNGALMVAQSLTSAAGQTQMAQTFKLPPVRRDLIQNVADDAAQQVFMQSALMAHGWYDPNPPMTNTVFRAMIESVVSGASTPADAVQTAAQALARLFPQNI